MHITKTGAFIILYTVLLKGCLHDACIAAYSENGPLEPVNTSSFLDEIGKIGLLHLHSSQRPCKNGLEGHKVGEKRLNGVDWPISGRNLVGFDSRK